MVRIGSAMCMFSSTIGKRNHENPPHSSICNEQRRLKVSVFRTCLDLISSELIPNQGKRNCTVCSTNASQGYNCISERLVIILGLCKNKHLDTVKPRIDCGFGEGNIVAHVALPEAEAYQCFYT